MENKYFNGSDLLPQIDGIQKWLASYDLNALASRYGKYENYINMFYSSEPLTKEGKKNFDLLTLTHQELIEIASVKNSFAGERSQGFIDRLSKVITGPDHIEGRVASESRNYLYELLVASRCKNEGFIMDFDKPTDVIAIQNGRFVFIECKRITSIRGFEEAFKKAGDQLRAEIRKPTYPQFMTRGFIFIDVLPYLLDKIPKFELEDELQARYFSKYIMKNFEHEAKRHIGKYLERYADVSMGLCITAAIPFWLKDLTSLRIDEMSVVIPESITDQDAHESEYLIRKLNGKLLPVV